MRCVHDKGQNPRGGIFPQGDFHYPHRDFSPRGFSKKTKVYLLIQILQDLMLMECKIEYPPVITIFHFPPVDFLKHLFKGLKSSLGSLLQSVFQVYNNILIFPSGKNTHVDISPQGFFPMGIFSTGLSS